MVTPLRKLRELIPNLIFSLSSLWFVYLGEPDVLTPFGQSSIWSKYSPYKREINMVMLYDTDK